MRTVRVVATILALVASSLSAAAQSALPTAAVAGRTSPDASARYRFAAPGPGVLTVVVRGPADTDTPADLVLLVTDAEGQVISRSDQDLDGSVAAEQAIVSIGQAGTFGVVVEVSGEASAFMLGSSFLPFRGLAVPADPDGAPSGAVRVAAGEAIDAELHALQGDQRDWYVFRAPGPGTVVAVTRGSDSGDLVLESFTAGNFTRNTDRSDQDLQGDGANESITQTVAAPGDVYFRASALSRRTEPIRYRMSLAFIPD